MDDLFFGGCSHWGAFFAANGERSAADRPLQ
jgi:hypothetical protein